MTVRLARIWRRLFWQWDVQVFGAGIEPECVHQDDQVIWAFHCRGVLHVISLWGGGRRDPNYQLVRYSFPLVNVGYWTKGR